MEPFLNRYYKLNLYLFLSIGFRISGRSRVHQLQSILVLLVLLFAAVSQIISIPFNTNVASVLRTITPTILSVIFFIKHVTLMRKWDEICYIFDHMGYDWKMIVDKEEKKILEEYATNARTDTYVFLGVILPSTILVEISIFLPWILDNVSPLNVTRTQIIQIDSSYVLDQEKYSGLFVTIAGMTTLFGTLVLLTFEAVLMMSMKHASSLFRITSYRLQRVLCNPPPNLGSEKRSNFGDEGSLISAIILHARALEFTEFTRANFMVSYGILLVLGTLSLTTGLYRISQVRLRFEDINEIITVVTLVIGHCGYCFFINHVVQLTSEESDSVFYNAYHTNWYNTSVSIQKQLRFIIHRSSEGFTCELWNVYRPSLEGFTAFMKTAFSYFMVIRSIQL